MIQIKLNKKGKPQENYGCKNIQKIHEINEKFGLNVLKKHNFAQTNTSENFAFSQRY